MMNVSKQVSVRTGSQVWRLVQVNEAVGREVAVQGFIRVEERVLEQVENQVWNFVRIQVDEQCS